MCRCYPLVRKKLSQKLSQYRQWCPELYVRWKLTKSAQCFGLVVFCASFRRGCFFVVIQFCAPVPFPLRSLDWTLFTCRMRRLATTFWTSLPLSEALLKILREESTSVTASENPCAKTCSEACLTHQQPSQYALRIAQASFEHMAFKRSRQSSILHACASSGTIVSSAEQRGCRRM